MKLAPALILMAMVVLGQKSPDSQIVDRLNSDFVPLHSLPGQEMLRDPAQLSALDRNALRDNLEVQNPGQQEAMSNLVNDLKGRYGKPVLSWDLSYVLTSALAGKALEKESLTTFTRSFLGSLDNALTCSRIRMPLRSCKQFEDSVKEMYAALLPLGVSSVNAQTVVEKFVDAAAEQVGPLFQPIPPASPLRPIQP